MDMVTAWKKAAPAGFLLVAAPVQNGTILSPEESVSDRFPAKAATVGDRLMDGLLARRPPSSSPASLI